MSDSKAIVDKLWNYCNILRSHRVEGYVSHSPAIPGRVTTVEA